MDFPWDHPISGSMELEKSETAMLSATGFGFKHRFQKHRAHTHAQKWVKNNHGFNVGNFHQVVI
jgi:hypothetical protein